jgi:hypothetical protein
VRGQRGAICWGEGEGCGVTPVKGVDRVKGGGLAPPVTPAVETEANVDSWSTYERGPSLVGSLGLGW